MEEQKGTGRDEIKSFILTMFIFKDSLNIQGEMLVKKRGILV